jgi:hypothetical protein
VWNRDLHGIAPERLAEARPVATVLAGEIVYRDSDAAAVEAKTGAGAGRAAGGP